MGDHQYHCPPIDNSPSSSISDTPPLRESPRMNMLPISGTHSFRQLMDLVIQEMSSQIDSVSSGSSPGLVLYHHSNPNRSFIDLRVDEAIKQCEDEEAEPNEEQQLAIPKRAEKIGDAFKLTAICEKCEFLSVVGSQIETCQHIQSKTTENQQLQKVVAAKTSKISRAYIRNMRRRRFKPRKAFREGKKIYLSFICANGRNIGVEWSLAPEVEE